MFCRAAACSVVQIKAESGAAGKDRTYDLSLTKGVREPEIPLVSGIFPANPPPWFLLRRVRFTEAHRDLSEAHLELGGFCSFLANPTRRYCISLKFLRLLLDGNCDGIKSDGLSANITNDGALAPIFS
jgi:hypothetical protein